MNQRDNRSQEELEGCRQLLELDQAVMAAILANTGEVTVHREELRRFLRERTTVRAAYDEAADTYRLWVERK